MPVTAHALKFSKVGSPDVLEWTTEELQQPAADQIQITQRAIGVNYIDIYHRSGLYPLPLPSGVGVEGVGIVEAVGENVKNFVPGDRVVYVGGPQAAMPQPATFRPLALSSCPTTFRPKSLRASFSRD